MAEKKVKEKYNSSFPHVNIGTMGHVDHGKTTLTAAITKALSRIRLAKFKDYGDIDKAPEEKKRGITISTTHIEFETVSGLENYYRKMVLGEEVDEHSFNLQEGRHYGMIDCPGHADYIKNTITGAAQMDGVIVVVSSADGSMTQTKEHLLLARTIGIERVVVFINDKTSEGLDEETKALLEADIRSDLETYGYDKEGEEKTPIIVASALKALKGDTNEEIKILQLLEVVDNHITIPERDESKPFLMYIEDVFSITGSGTVVTGNPLQGKLRKGDEVEIVGLGPKKKSVVKGIEMFQKEMEEAKPGDTIGVCLRDIKLEEVRKGQALAAPGTVTPHKKFKAHAYILSKEERGRHTSFEDGYRPQFFTATINITGTVKLPSEKKVEPGSDIEFEVDLIEPVVIRKNDNFAMREGGITVGIAINGRTTINNGWEIQKFQAQLEKERLLNKFARNPLVEREKLQE
ncbi:31855_t:CDS:2 [Racocetra persica]|uniref:31855_t:CDS:1 n=1 Tax=Racocetra persica TaxID=160502 RepID=A0ACA9KWZ8_9GLOM|nr:31855_t:CDS:2 [Racocetra persica]